MWKPKRRAARKRRYASRGQRLRAARARAHPGFKPDDLIPADVLVCRLLRGQHSAERVRYHYPSKTAMIIEYESYSFAHLIEHLLSLTPVDS